MKRALSALAAIVLPVTGWAQAPITALPLLPPTQQTAPQAPPPGAVATPGAPTPIPAAPAPVQSTWLPQGTAVLQALDKVNAQSSVLTVKVGASAQFGSLTIQVQACDIRPPDQPQDATALLAITDSHADAPGFSGWMLAGNPSLSMLQHPIYDVRVVGCKA